MFSKVNFPGSMKLLRTVMLPLLLVSFICSSALQAIAGDSAALFTKKCAACHTIGGGNRVGPDLAPFAKLPDPVLSKAIKTMEKNVGKLSDEDLSSLMDYMKNPKSAAKAEDSKTDDSKKAEADKPSAEKAVSQEQKTSGQTAATSQEQAAVVQPSEADLRASAKRGSRLFCGDDALQNGGLACVACHRVDEGGGNVGPDLTAVASKISDKDLVSIFEQNPCKVNNAAYKDHQVMHPEAEDLAQYFVSLKSPHKPLNDAPVTAVGFALGIFAFWILAASHRQRQKLKNSLAEPKGGN